MNILFDEAGAPSMRSVFGSLLTHSQRADIALANMRLAALDLTDDEIGTVRLRTLLGRFEAGTVGSFGGHTERLDGLRRLLASDRV
ncbi:MAG TPA: hypothetical protein VMN60_06425, partial [Longimicrobiales bacterium]|nr:hypothetical protein [Longimicrobiales bacterium]